LVRVAPDNDEARAAAIALAASRAQALCGDQTNLMPMALSATATVSSAFDDNPLSTRPEDQFPGS
jgi:hypothetical protein